MCQVVAPNTTLKDIMSNEPLREEGKPITLGIVVMRALLAAGKEEIPGDEQVKRYLLATRFKTESETIELQAEDVVLVLKQVAAMFGPMITGQIYTALGEV